MPRPRRNLRLRFEEAAEVLQNSDEEPDDEEGIDSDSDDEERAGADQNNNGKNEKW